VIERDLIEIYHDLVGFYDNLVNFHGIFCGKFDVFHGIS
jgi:hypothetical protein